MARKETLCQKADDKDEEALGLTEAEFYKKLKDLKTLYHEITELIQQAKNFRVFSKNYYKQLVETKQALQRSEIAGGTPTPSKGQRSTKLLNLPLFNGSTKDRVIYNNCHKCRFRPLGKRVWSASIKTILNYRQERVWE
ncbi:hypothetical protein GP486_006860 [Trichoglossum hirsutum]|uniref:Uncharacterized protein n=1 Tax=Trichoglossum hirsutum TaxID=265104 RepID=A0A9P8L7Q6_9PEZI|nr:hypothetical protein GP486_006860 [Trichoglossum hirsutum]